MAVLHTAVFKKRLIFKLTPLFFQILDRFAMAVRVKPNPLDIPFTRTILINDRAYVQKLFNPHQLLSLSPEMSGLILLLLGPLFLSLRYWEFVLFLWYVIYWPSLLVPQFYCLSRLIPCTVHLLPILWSYFSSVLNQFQHLIWDALFFLGPFLSS